MSEERKVFIYIIGGSGKSTLIEAIRQIYGDNNIEIAEIENIILPRAEIENIILPRADELKKIITIVETPLLNLNIINTTKNIINNTKEENIEPKEKIIEIDYEKLKTKKIREKILKINKKISIFIRAP